MQKRQIWVSELHFEEVRGDVQPWLMARWKGHGQLSIRVIERSFFAIYYGSGVLGEICAVRPVCSQILPEHGRPPSTILGSEN